MTFRGGSQRLTCRGFTFTDIDMRYELMLPFPLRAMGWPSKSSSQASSPRCLRTFGIYSRFERTPNRRSLKSNHHLVQFFPRLGRMAYRDRRYREIALILTAITSRHASSQTPTDPTFLLSQCHPTRLPKTNKSTFSYTVTKPATAILWHPVDLQSRLAVIPALASYYLVFYLLHVNLQIKKKKKKGVCYRDISKIWDI